MAARIPTSPVSRPSGFNRCFDLQIIQGLRQVKTQPDDRLRRFPDFFRLQAIGVRLACCFS
jgi:hypothetical protein